MKYISFLIIFFSVFNGYSQQEDFKRFHIGLLFSPEYSYRTIKNVYPEKTFYNERTHAIFGFQTGIIFEYRILKWLAIETGFKLAKKGFTETYGYGNQTISNPPVNLILNYRSFYFELPVKINFHYFQTEKIKLFGSIAFTSSYLLQNKVKKIVEYEDGSTSIVSADKSDDIRGNNISGALGLGVDYYPTPYLGIRLEPFFNHAFIPDYKISIYNGYGFGNNKYYQWSMGVRFAVFYVF